MTQTPGLEKLEFLSNSPTSTFAFGRRLGKKAEPGSTIALIGELGCGKTLLTRGICAGLGVPDRRVSSPTFVFVNEYTGRLPVFHMDLYRLSGVEEGLGIGLLDYLARGKEGVVIVEWAEKVISVLPDDYLRIDFETLSAKQRRLMLTARGEKSRALIEELGQEVIVLGIDTSAYANAVGVVDGDVLLSDFVFEAKTDSLQRIVSHIDAALKKAGLSLKDVEGYGVGLGPGSWTGIRVGVTVAKMLAYATGKPVCGIPTLEVLAHGAGDRSKQVCAVMSVGTGNAVYAAFYRAANGTLARHGDYYVGDLPGLGAMITEPILLVGPEAAALGQSLRQTGIDMEARGGVARGAEVARLAASRLERGEADDALALAPLYLKEYTARVFAGRYTGKLGE